ncbi:Os09g0384450 [Oryza sativa Japonica Group]|uniref:Os09g0384450 protein n=1 Tax=Oryza sativa subsp. japonica TaxID=39947 RepID=A0A0P0XMJ0_ORYSJ|nr:Os09g0384450 [Oryza sativa Japonica Group]
MPSFLPTTANFATALITCSAHLQIKNYSEIISTRWFRGVVGYHRPEDNGEAPEHLRRTWKRRQTAERASMAEIGTVREGLYAGGQAGEKLTSKTTRLVDSISAQPGWHS